MVALFRFSFNIPMFFGLKHPRDFHGFLLGFLKAQKTCCLPNLLFLLFPHGLEAPAVLLLSFVAWLLRMTHDVRQTAEIA